MGAQRSTGVRRVRRAVVVVTVALTALATSAAGGSAARLYVTVGDSVGAGMGATSGHSFSDLYCQYLKSAAGGARVDQCVNESVAGLTTQSALDGGVIARTASDIRASTDTPVVTVVLGGNDLLASSGCAPITGPHCHFLANMRSILNQLETALATHPGPHVIQWLEYYNPSHDNPFANPTQDGATAGLLLGSDQAYTDCGATALAPIGLDDAINCITREKGATPVDAYQPFQAGCAAGNCFSDALHPNDKGYGLIFSALRDTPASPVPSTPPADLSWPFSAAQVTPPPEITALRMSRRTFAVGSGRRQGTVFALVLSQGAAVTLTLQRLSGGRLIGARCRPATPARRHRPACTRVRSLGNLYGAARDAGLLNIRFSGRLDDRALSAGYYRAVATAANGSGRASERDISFRIRRG
jgi:lysophospholipase L1-like esterase